MDKNWEDHVFGPFFKIIQDDSIYVDNYFIFYYGSVLCYITLYIRLNMRKNVSRKVVKKLNLRQKTETSTKKDLIFMEVTYWNTRILEQILLIGIFSTIKVLIYNINGIRILEVIKSTFFLSIFGLYNDRIFCNKKNVSFSN